MKRKLNFIIAVVLFLFWGFYTFGFEKYIHSNLTSTPIVMAKTNINKGELITSDKVYINPFPTKLTTSSMVRNTKLVIGRIAKFDIDKNQTINKNMLESSMLRPNDNYRLIPIPRDWIKDMPDSLRRLDKVDIIALPTVSDNKNNQTNISNDTKITNNSSVDVIDGPILKQIVVAYVKSSRNSEIVGTSKKNPRLDGSSIPSEIELSMTYKQFDILQKYHNLHYQFVLTY